MSAGNKHFAWCNNANCGKKDDCIRYSEDKNIMYIKFERLMQDDNCGYFIKEKRDIVVKEEDDKDEEKTT